MCCTEKADVFSLDGKWQFTVDSTGLYDCHEVVKRADWREVKVPLAWQTQFADLRDYQGIAWYYRVVNIPVWSETECVIIEFKAVDYQAELFVNNKYVGVHEGGYTPFCFDITDYVRPGDNVILLRVIDPVANEEGTEGISYWYIPHGKQNWYVQCSGIWQSVFLHIRPRRHIDKVKITPAFDGSFRLDIQLEPVDEFQINEQLVLCLFDPRDKEVFKKVVAINSTDTILHIADQIDSPRLWSPDQPSLYTAEVVLNGEDVFRTRFGFRKFEVRDGQFYLNEKPFYVIGALDQDFYPETNYTTPSEKYLRDEFGKAKALGLNLLRCHIKIPDERYYKVADEEGMLIWAEVPNWDVFSPIAAQRASETIDAMLERDWNHPSLVIMSLINESWGINLQKADQRAWLKTEFDRVKQLTPDRIIVDNSACWGNFHLKTEINDYHTYWAIPENHHKFAETVQEVNARPNWLFSPFGDGEETGKEALMISEFGNWGLPQLPEVLPFWFKRQFLDDWITMPDGVHQRFKEYKYDRIFKNYNDLALTSQCSQVAALKWEIEEIRLQPEMAGYVITEFTDINWECNGLLDMWRNPKANHEVLAMVQQPDVIIPRLPKYAYWDNESVGIQLTVSHYSSHDLTSAKIYVREDGKIITQTNVYMKSHGVFPLGVITVPAESVDLPSRRRIDFQMVDGENTILTQNFIEFTVVPHSWLKLDTTNRNVIFTNNIDGNTLSHLHDGQNVICLAGPESVFPQGFPYKIQSRETDWYDGNWVSNLNWVLYNHKPFVDMNCNAALGFEAFGVLPDYVITNVPATQFDDVLAGMYVGWLHLNSAYLVQLRVGNGKLLLSTFNLEQSYGEDPFATMLRNELVNYILSDKCQPGIQWNP